MPYIYIYNDSGFDDPHQESRRRRLTRSEERKLASFRASDKTKKKKKLITAGGAINKRISAESFSLSCSLKSSRGSRMSHLVPRPLLVCIYIAPRISRFSPTRC